MERFGQLNRCDHRPGGLGAGRLPHGSVPPASCCGGAFQAQRHRQQQRQRLIWAVPENASSGAAQTSSSGTTLGIPSAAAGSAASERPGIDGAGGGAVAAVGAGPAARDLGLEPFRALVEGRRFMCTMCGKCCTGEGEIWVSPDEVGRIAKHLNLSVQRFLDTYTKQYSKYKGWRMLKTQEATSACIFLGADNKCAIHAVRPSQCSTYPWWPELTVDREWEWEKANVCEGFDHAEAGPLDVDEAARQLREANKMTQLRLMASTVRLTPQVAEWADDMLLWDAEPEPAAAKGKTSGGDAAKKPRKTKGGRPSN